MVHRKMRRVAVRRHTMMKLTMFLFSLLFVATAAKNVDPHGVEAFAAAKLGSPDYKASVMPDEKDSFESAFDGWSTFQLTRRGLSAVNRFQACTNCLQCWAWGEARQKSGERPVLPPSRMMMMVLLHWAPVPMWGSSSTLCSVNRCAPNTKSQKKIDKSACSSTLVPGTGFS